MAKMKTIISDAKEILKEHNLCDNCLGRLFASKLGLTSHQKLGKKIRSILGKNNPKSCFICKNMMSKLDTQLSKMYEMSHDYEFSSFLVGAILQPSILDRDDLIRSKFRLQGINSIKGDINREIGKRFGRKTKTSVDYQNPDLVFTLDFKNEECEIKPKPLFLSARYTKNIRGIPQKQKPCSQCRGKGCYACEFHGISEFESVEGKIARFLYEKFGAQQAKITWIGSEDETSLVLGKGRPFFAKLVNPHKRMLRLSKKIALDGVVIRDMKVIEKIPSNIIRFRSKVAMQVQTKNEIKSSQLRNLRKLEKQPIAIYENSGKKNQRYVSDIQYKKKSSNSFSLLMKADGGVPLKRFADGVEVTPSLSSILENPCKCTVFDFYEIALTK
ncbi:MAG TPA: tRNA pseudouridine(54/55) synthase Pus10 [Nitrosopumilaceae archaeon]|nr:tRNA pseudouridine(54/55) synthase Pus10 [Nitrosopumilaceae archaeon]